MISIIVPTYKEKSNIGKLLKDIANLKIHDLQIIVVDDNSPDGTAEEVENLKNQIDLKIKLLRRTGQRDLSLSVLDGFKAAEGKIIGVMDADGSHPSSIIPEILEKLKTTDLVVASRNLSGSETKNWPWKRKVNAWVAKKLARSLTKVTSDPMSGFFFFKKEVVENVTLKPLGYKILLEILVKGKYQKVSEVPFVFEDRKIGQSKLNLRIILKFLFHILKLQLWKISHSK